MLVVMFVNVPIIMAKSSKCDVFPALVVKDFSSKNILPLYPDFKKITETYSSKLIPFIITLEGKIVHYYPIDLNNVTRKHFKDTAAAVNNTSVYKVAPWDSIEKRINQRAKKILRNTDVRTCFKFHNNFFLTKSCFTFGQRKVLEGTHHLIQIGSVPMAFYVPSPNSKPKLKEKMFYANEQHKFSYRKLEQCKSYRIPENTVYIVCTMQRTFFALHVIESTAKLPFLTINPIPPLPQRPPPPRDIYKRPIQTPLIEDLQSDSENENEDLDRNGAETLSHKKPRLDTDLLSPLTSTREAVALPSVLNANCMPPPHVLPLPPTQPIQIIKQVWMPHIPTEKVIQIVNPNFVKWYQDLKNVQYGDPVDKTFQKWDGSGPDKVWDLSCKKSIDLQVSTFPSPFLTGSPGTEHVLDLSQKSTAVHTESWTGDSQTFPDEVSLDAPSHCAEPLLVDLEPSVERDSVWPRETASPIGDPESIVEENGACSGQRGEAVEFPSPTTDVTHPTSLAGEPAQETFSATEISFHDVAFGEPHPQNVSCENTYFQPVSTEESPFQNFFILESHLQNFATVEPHLENLRLQESIPSLGMEQECGFALENQHENRSTGQTPSETSPVEETSYQTALVIDPLRNVKPNSDVSFQKELKEYFEM